MILNKKIFQKVHLLLVLIGLSCGSAFYVFYPYTKPAILLPLISLPLLILSIKIKVRMVGILLIGFILLAFVYNFSFKNEDNIIDLYYISILFFVYTSANIAAKITYRRSHFLFFILFFIFTVLVFLYAYEVNSGVQIVNKPYDILGVYSTVFNNPNDMSAYLTSFLALALFLTKRKYKSISITVSVYIMVVLLIFFLGSRLSFLSAMLLAPLYLLLSKKNIYIGVVFLVNIFIFNIVNWEYFLYMLTNVDIDFISRSASRMLLFLYQFDEDKSATYRLDSYYYVIENFGNTLLGAGTKNYEDFYSGSIFSGTVVAINPHSFFIEVVLAFGWLGLLIIILILGIIAKSYYRLKGDTFVAAIISIVIFSIVSFVPSTIIRLPILFFPILFFYHLSFNDREK